MHFCCVSGILLGTQPQQTNTLGYRVQQSDAREILNSIAREVNATVTESQEKEWPRACAAARESSAGIKGQSVRAEIQTHFSSILIIIIITLLIDKQHIE